MIGKPFCENCGYEFKHQREYVCPRCYESRVMEEDAYHNNSFDNTSYSSDYSNYNYQPKSDTNFQPKFNTTYQNYKKPKNNILILVIVFVLIGMAMPLIILNSFNTTADSYDFDKPYIGNYAYNNSIVSPYLDYNYEKIAINFNKPFNYDDIIYTITGVYNIGTTFKGVNADEGKTFIAVKFGANNVGNQDKLITFKFEYIDNAESKYYNKDYLKYFSKSINHVYDLDFNEYQNLILKPYDIVNGYFVFQAVNVNNSLDIDFGINVLRLRSFNSPMYIMKIYSYDVQELNIN